MQVYDYEDFYKNCVPSQLLEQIGFEFVSNSGDKTRMRYPGDDHFNPSVVVNESNGAVYCHRGNYISDNSNAGSVFQALVHIGNLSKQEAYLAITGESNIKYTPPLVKRKTKSPVIKQLDWLTVDYIKQWSANIKPAKRFLKTRMISMDYAKHLHLGYKPNHLYKKEYTFPDGFTVHTQPCNRHTIPIFRTIPKPHVFAFSLRLDDIDAEKRMEDMDEDLIDEIKKRGKKPKELLFGPKYLNFKTSNFIFQSWLLAKYVDGQMQYQDHPYAIATESPYDAINLFEIGGQPAVATKSHPYLNEAFSRVGQIIFIKDNDKPKIDANGNMFCAGDRIAEQFQKKLNRPVKILSPYPEFKDVGDMAQAGVLKQWLQENNLTYKI